MCFVAAQAKQYKCCIPSIATDCRGETWDTLFLHSQLDMKEQGRVERAAFSPLCSPISQTAKISTEAFFTQAYVCLFPCDTGGPTFRDPSRGPIAHSLDLGDCTYLLPVMRSSGSPGLLQMALWKNLGR